MAETPVSLLERLRQRPDAGAWQEFVDLYTPLLHDWLKRHFVQGPDVDDLVQDVLGVVVRELPSFRHNQRAGAFRHWLRTVTSHRLHDFWRGRRYRPEVGGSGDFAKLLEQLEDPASDLSRQWEREHDRHVVQRLLARIRSEFRDPTWSAFEAVMLGGATPAEAAERLGVSVNAVLLAKSRVLHRLRQVGQHLLD